MIISGEFPVIGDTVDDPRRRLMTTSQTERSSAPEAIEDQLDSGGPSREV